MKRVATVLWATVLWGVSAYGAGADLTVGEDCGCAGSKTPPWIVPFDPSKEAWEASKAAQAVKRDRLLTDLGADGNPDLAALDAAGVRFAAATGASVEKPDRRVRRWAKVALPLDAVALASAVANRPFGLSLAAKAEDADAVEAVMGQCLVSRLPLRVETDAAGADAFVKRLSNYPGLNVLFAGLFFRTDPRTLAAWAKTPGVYFDTALPDESPERLQTLSRLSGRYQTFFAEHPDRVVFASGALPVGASPERYPQRCAVVAGILARTRYAAPGVPDPLWGFSLPNPVLARVFSQNADAFVNVAIP